MHIIQVMVIITYKDMSRLSYFNIVKTILFIIDFFLRNIFKGENIKLKLVSLFMFFVISCINIFVVVRLLVYGEM